MLAPSSKIKTLEEDDMSGKHFKRGALSPPRYLALSLLLTACGDDLAVESRMASGVNLEPEIRRAGTMDSEDIIAIMGAPDKAASQKTSNEDQAARESSLIPLNQFTPPGDPLIINDQALSLQTEQEDIKEITDLRSFDTPIRNQGSRPWCTAFATIGAMENLAKRIYGIGLDLSEIHHFKSYGVYQTTPSLNAAKTQGLIDEEAWPYYGNRKLGAGSKIRSRLTDSKKIQLTLSDVVQSIQSQQPVVINLIVNSSFMNPKSGGIVVPGGLQHGGHAIALTGVVLDQRVASGGYFIIKNSWGSSWGNQGYGYIPFSYCKYSSCYAWSVGNLDVLDDNGRLRGRLADQTPLPSPNPKPAPGEKPSEPPTTPDAILADNFKIVSQLKDYRGLLGAYFYTLTLSADQQLLNKISSVTYKVEGYRDFVSSITTPTSHLDSDDILSRSYRIWPGQLDQASATVKLKDGREINLRGINVEF